jgi:uncharacterized membrane protein
MKRIILTILTSCVSALTLFFSNTFFVRLKMNYNEEGNYFDESSGVVYHDQAIFIYCIITLILLLLTIFTIWKLIQNFKTNEY